MIRKITIAVDNGEEMSEFYNQVLGWQLQKIPLDGFCMYQTIQNDVQILFCPKTIAGIKATENNIQLMFQVANLNYSLSRAKELKSEIISQIEETQSGKTVALRDPDGNSLELIEFC